MLKIIIEYDPVEDKISDVSDYFDGSYEKWWFNSDLAKAIIKGIDESEHIKDEFIESPVLGAIPPTMLSSGCKGCLLLLNEPDIIVSGERFGDNCFVWLNKIGQIKDITITMHHFLADWDIELNAFIINDNSVVHTSGELNTKILRLGM